MRILDKANPNRHGTIFLVEYSYDDVGHVWIVTEPGEPFYCGQELDSEADARKTFDALVAYYTALPNWDAQAEYDNTWAPLPCVGGY